MTYTINGKEYTEFDINKRCAEIMGLIVKDEFEERCGFTKGFREKYPHTVWAAKTDKRGAQCDAWEQKLFTSYPQDAWQIIEKCWDELMDYTMLLSSPLHYSDSFQGTKWQFLMKQHNCTKLTAACICYIEMNEGQNDLSRTRQ